MNRRSILLCGTAALSAVAGASLLALRRDGSHTPMPHTTTSSRPARPAASPPPAPQLWFTLIEPDNELSLGSVVSVAFSPDGKTLAIAGMSVCVADLATRQIRSTQPTDQGIATCVAFSPGGRILASTDNLGEVLLWPPATRAHTATLGWDPNWTTDGNSNVHAHSVAFSPDGRTLAAGYDGVPVQLWDVAPRKSTALNSGDLDPTAGSVAFSPDGKSLAIGGSPGAQIWDVANRILTYGSTTPDFTAVGQVAFSPDSRTLAISGVANKITLYNLATHASINLDAGTPMGLVAFSPDGKTLAAGGPDGTIQLWDMTTRAHAALQTHTAVTSIGFSPDSKTLATGSSGGIIHIWKFP